ncbi:MAG: osmoprotectant transporter permease [Pseudomonadota bacterium]
MIFWILWAVNAAVAAIVVTFFLAGLADGSVSSFNIGLWLAILAAGFVILVGSLALRGKGHAVLALLLVIPAAAAGILYALFILLVIVSGERWN